MVARKKKSAKVKVPPLSDPLKQIHLHAAGIDAHSREHFVAVPAGSAPKDFVNPDANLPPHIRIFGTNTGDLEACAAWLKVCQVETVAVESTGVYHLRRKRRSRRLCKGRGRRNTSSNCVRR